MALLKQVQISVSKEHFKFSAGHFTIFSATHRENLHGHNFSVEVRVTSTVGGDGLAFDYGALKEMVTSLCEALNEHFLLPGKSPHLLISSEGDYVIATFNDEKIPFLPRDVLVLPIENVTLEGLSNMLLEQLIDKMSAMGRFHAIDEIELKTFSGPGQCVATFWKKREQHS